MVMLKSGSKAPNFSLPDQDGKMVTLRDFCGKQSVVLFFYPKDFTSGCTTEACSFRDNYSAFAKLGAQVIGISADGPNSHKDFSSKYQLPYPLLSDVTGEVATLYGVEKSWGILPGRVSYVVDKTGVVTHAVSAQILVNKHIDETLAALKSD